MPKKMTKKERLRRAGDAAKRARTADVINITMEELEAIIAEQSKPENLPSWWFEDTRRAQKISDGEIYQGTKSWTRPSSLLRNNGSKSKPTSRRGSKVRS